MKHRKETTIKIVNVYFIQRGNDGPIKIGGTNGDPLIRLASLQTSSPEKLYVLGCVRGNESEVHDRFHDHHLSGEWFEPHQDIISFARLNNATPASGSNADDVVGVRIPGELRAALERERQWMSKKAGAEVKMSAVIRSILEGALQRLELE